MNKVLKIFILACCFNTIILPVTNNFSGKTFLRIAPAFQSGSELNSALFNTASVQQHNKKYNCSLEFKAFGSKNTERAAAAAYFLPYGHKTLNFDGKPKLATFDSVAATVEIQAVAGSGSETDLSAGNPNIVYFTPQTSQYGLADSNPPLFDATNALYNAGVAKEWANGDALATEINTGNAAINAGQNQVGIPIVNSPLADAFIPATYKYDTNTDTSVVKPWNFGITFAALFEPLAPSAKGAALGSGLVTSPNFNSKISPEFLNTNYGFGAKWRQYLSSEKQTVWLEVSTALEYVKNEIKLNETIITQKDILNSTNFNPSNWKSITSQGKTANYSGAQSLSILTFSGATLNSSLADTYLNTNSTPTGAGFPVDGVVANYTASIANVTAAFAQNASGIPTSKVWRYGKINGPKTRKGLADIEIKLGRQLIAEESHSTNMYFGVIIPTGNKPTAEYVAEPIVGNGQHFGCMTGGSTELCLNTEKNVKISYRIDTNLRYLFKNTQKRSFDLIGNEWSRYMMVWKETDFNAAFAAVNANITSATAPNYSNVRNYTPGINEFTTDFYITPQFQGKCNQALFLEFESCSLELGWNCTLLSKEKVELAKKFSSRIAFADPNYAEAGVNKFRKIYNDMTLYNAFYGISNNITSAQFSQNIIKVSDINFDSVAAPSALTNTPYFNFAYSWDSKNCPGAISLGASYDISNNNAALNKYKLSLGFNLYLK